ncbi:MAG: class I SAM-dependent methyltransferase [Gammaproteobacteria bacterium]|nr:class I SAM-dependent methyltransferase [Gammaproteobacteria bacterium]MDH4255275.1 class I SAM-dependent methyltransferase [Gammaproteobacteria bacterium]MDH5310006.1 class I SAM-dependent methyltransferase [Gammaproteobacteria bacterium]
MNDVKTHYDELLGSVYSWILGDFDQAYAKNSALLDELDVRPVSTGIAIDLGAGPGCQSLPLADRGYKVIAVDFCAELLGELQSHAADRNVRTVCGDICDFRRHAERADLVVCMGDTLVHLPDRTCVAALLDDIAATLVPGGAAIITIRDYVSPGPTGAKRFIPIRSTADRIFTCFLEYGEDVVNVHDILQRRTAEGWTLEVSGYRKLRLDLDWVAGRLAASGLTVERRFESGGMLGLLLRR